MIINVELLTEPRKAPCDRKLYRLLKLSNGMKILLIKNAELRDNSAGVALAINVGSFDDPKDIQGLSHFTEHMVRESVREYFNNLFTL